jgi:ribosomal protein L11 methyltransferase
VTAVLFACGCTGTAMDLLETGADLVTPRLLTAWFPDTASRDEAALRLGEFNQGLESGIQPSEDWLARWREGQLPFTVGRRLLVIPGEGDPVPDEHAHRLVIRITPGLAFGTGHHETTCFCLRQLEERSGPGVEFLDVGTGSGILAVAAILLGCPRAVGIDKDPQAVPVAAANVQRHGLARRVDLLVSENSETALLRSFPLVAANILGSTLIAMAPLLTGPLLEPGGHLLLAGILAGEEERDVLHTYQNLGLICRHREVDGEWAGLVLAKTGG